MSWATCTSGCNNIHFNYPPIMNDGRNYADWQPGSIINERIRQQAGINSNWQYRNYLTHNAKDIMKTNLIEACNQCGVCNYSTANQLQPQPNNPYIFNSPLENSMPFGYENSDLKEKYLSKYQLQCRMITPVLTQEQLLQQGYHNAN